ncbi:MAG: tetratricopeptide repeat protein [Promethearchaeota archaeon]
MNEELICECGGQIDRKYNICLKCGAHINPLEMELKRKAFEASETYMVVQASKLAFIGIDPKHPFYEGMKLIEQLKLQEALVFHDKEIKTHPDDELLWNNLGATYMGLTNRREALKCYQKALEINPKYHISTYNVGGVYFVCSKFVEAIKYFDKTLEINPHCAEAVQDRKLSYQGLENYEFGKGMSEDPFNSVGLNLARAKMNESRTLVDLGNGKDAILGIYKYHLKNFNQFRELFEEGQKYYSEKRYQESFQCFDKALQLNPQDWYVFTVKGLALAKLNKIDEALNCLDAATKIQPNYESAWINKGNILGMKGRFKQALFCFEQVLRINPFNNDVIKPIQAAKQLLSP